MRSSSHWCLCLAAPWIAPHDPAEIHLINRLKPPGFIDSTGHQYWLGTDSLGRDVYSRVVYGARVSLTVGLSAVLISGTVGLLLGLISGFFGGWLDDVIMRIADTQLSFPTILLALAIMAVLGSGLDGYPRPGPWLVQAHHCATSSVGEAGGVRLAARATGERNLRILFEHILPNIWSPVIVIASFSVATNIIAEASLSFLGVGVPPSVPSWGAMLADGRQFIGLAEWLTIPAGLAISLTVLSINILGDWLRDFIDPRLKNIM